MAFFSVRGEVQGLGIIRLVFAKWRPLGIIKENFQNSPVP